MTCARPWAPSSPRETPCRRRRRRAGARFRRAGRDRLLASASGIPFELGIIRNHYVGRTFIQPTQSIRELGVRMKHSANRAVVDGKRIVLIDDSSGARHDLEEDRAR